MKIFFAALILLLLTACAAMSNRMETRSPSLPATGPLITDISILTLNVPPGAYTIEVRYDPEILAIGTIRPPDRDRADAFPGYPVSDPRSYGTGKTIITSTSSFLEPQKLATDARTHVATIEWKRLRPGKTMINLRMTGIYDLNGKTISGAIQPPFVEVEENR